MKFFSLILVAVTFIGCGLVEPPEDNRDSGLPVQYEFTADKQVYGPGETATLRLENNSDHMLGYNLCFSTLVQKIENGWKSIEGPQDQACIAILFTLKPGNTASFKFQLFPNLSKGQYRFKTKIEKLSNGVVEERFSNVFSINLSNKL